MATGNRIAIVLAVIISQVASQDTCQGNLVDLRSVTLLEFVEGKFAVGGKPQLQCGGGYCVLPDAGVTYASCTNNNRITPVWNCAFTFRGSGYAVSSYDVNCPGFSGSNACVLKDSCSLQYTLTRTSQPVAVFSGVGGGVSFIIFCAIVYWCCCRRKKTDNRVVNIIRTEPARRPSPPSTPAPAVTQTNVTVNVAPPAAPPAAPAPTPVYLVQAQPMPAYVASPPMPAYVAPPPPPFNPHYAPSAPTGQGYH